MYGLLSGRPVRTVYFSAGGFTIEGFNSSTGEFEPEQFLLTRIYVDYYTVRTWISPLYPKKNSMSMF